MIVHDFDIPGICTVPAETDAPLIVDANAPLALSVPMQLLQPIPWRDAESFDLCSSGKHIKLAQRYSGYRRIPSIVSSLVQLLGILALERRNHARSILRTA